MNLVYYNIRNHKAEECGKDSFRLGREPGDFWSHKKVNQGYLLKTSDFSWEWNLWEWSFLFVCGNLSKSTKRLRKVQQMPFSMKLGDK